MTVNHAFLAFMALVGALVGFILVVGPEGRDYRLPPYFRVLVAMAAFEAVAFARGRGARGVVVWMDAGLGGSLLAIVLTAGDPVRVGGSARLL